MVERRKCFIRQKDDFVVGVLESIVGFSIQKEDIYLVSKYLVVKDVDFRILN